MCEPQTQSRDWLELRAANTANTAINQPRFGHPTTKAFIQRRQHALTATNKPMMTTTCSSQMEDWHLPLESAAMVADARLDSVPRPKSSLAK